MLQKLVHNIYADWWMPTFIAKLYMVADAMQVKKEVDVQLRLLSSSFKHTRIRKIYCWTHSNIWEDFEGELLMFFFFINLILEKIATEARGNDTPSL